MLPPTWLPAYLSALRYALVMLLSARRDWICPTAYRRDCGLWCGRLSTAGGRAIESRIERVNYLLLTATGCSGSDWRLGNNSTRPVSSASRRDNEIKQNNRVSRPTSKTGFVLCVYICIYMLLDGTKPITVFTDIVAVHKCTALDDISEECIYSKQRLQLLLYRPPPPQRLHFHR